MPKVQHSYKGTPHRRIMTAADFRSVGVEDQDRAEWTPETRHVQEVSDAAAEYLTSSEDGFKVVKESVGDEEDDEEDAPPTGESLSKASETPEGYQGTSAGASSGSPSGGPSGIARGTRGGSRRKT